MLHLIEGLAERLLPKPLHRLGLRGAHRMRHWYRRIAKPQLSGVSVILRDDEGRVLLVRHSYGPQNWSLPGGGLASGEEPEPAARREMREELAVELEGLGLLTTLDEQLSGTQHTAYVFTATTGDVVRPDGREIAKARFFALDKLPTDLSCIAKDRLARAERH